MYVKIEKDISGNYLLLEAKQIDMRNMSFMMELKDYINGLVLPLIEDGSITKEARCFSREGREKLSSILPPCFAWENVKSVTDIDPYAKDTDESYNCNCAVKGIIADGICYITYGNIYILNDKGQTIQRV
jgi:hypothetical protein